MILLLWFFVGFLPTAASAVALTYLFLVVGVVLRIYFLTVSIAVLLKFWLTTTVSHFVERRGGVKFILLRVEWLIAAKRWLKRVNMWLICDRRRSISGDHWEQVQAMLTSTFLKRGTFIVLNLNDCGFSQWMYFSLARDACNA
ncbi:hypothetical protein [uncultured Gimesia sp.]|uniref:hypothetical protein n=1 Tax=uncultured Gimesia sp. TaxID=1678688 RepID=UPI002625B32E|nr:hypothetical protein [uncultured Gimesia sp.]